MKHVAIYVRQSQDKAGDETAVDRQELSCRKLAEAKGWEGLVLYRDNDRSATSGKERPEFERLLTEVEKGRVSAVIVWHLDRLTRSIRDLTRVIEAGKSQQVNIACVQGVSLDLGDPTGVAVATILTAIAAMEVQHKGKRQREANRQRATAGGAFWTRRPFGYDRGPNGVHVVESEAEAIRAAATAVLNGSTLSAIAKELTTAGHTTTAGGAWGVTQTRRLLLNPRYAGRRPYVDADGAAAEAVGDWDPILDNETHRALAERLLDPRRRTAPDDLNAKYLLSGICICGKCGKKMYAAPIKAKGREWMAYRCFGGYCMTRRLDYVDDVVQLRTIAILARPDASALFTDAQDSIELRHKANDLRERRDSIASMYADGLLSETSARQQAGRLSQEIQAISDSLATSDVLNPAAAVISSADTDDAWHELSLGSKRQIIRALMDVTVLPAGKGTRFAPEQVLTTPKGKTL